MVESLSCIVPFVCEWVIYPAQYTLYVIESRTLYVWVIYPAQYLLYVIESRTLYSTLYVWLSHLPYTVPFMCDWVTYLV